MILKNRDAGYLFNYLKSISLSVLRFSQGKSVNVNSELKSVLIPFKGGGLAIDATLKV